MGCGVGVAVVGVRVGAADGAHVDMLCTVAPQLLHEAVWGKSMDIVLGKAPTPMDTMFAHPAKKITDFNEEHKVKACVAMVVTLAGTEILVSAV